MEGVNEKIDRATKNVKFLSHTGYLVGKGLRNS